MKIFGARIESWILLVIASIILLMSFCFPLTLHNLHLNCIHSVINGIDQYWCPNGA